MCVPIKWDSLVLRLKLIDERSLFTKFANFLTKVVLPVPFGPMIKTNSPNLYALSSMSRALFQSKYSITLLLFDDDDAVVVDETEDAEDIKLNFLRIYLIKIYRNFFNNCQQKGRSI